MRYWQTYRWRAGWASGGGSEEVEGWSEKGKGPRDIDNSVVIAGEGGKRGQNGNGKNTLKIK